MSYASDEGVRALAAAFGRDMGEVKPNVRKINTNATRAPLPTDDASQGYEAGSRWQHEGQEFTAARTPGGAIAWVPGEATPHGFGARADGDHDDSDAVEAAFMSGLPVALPAGEYVLTRTINARHPLTVTSRGEGRAVFIHRNLAGADGIKLLHDGALRGQETRISGVDVVLEGSDGGSWLKTPEGTAARNLLPKYNLDGVRWHQPGAVRSDYGWQWAANFGEGDAHIVSRCEYYGSYNPTAAPTAANIRSGFVRYGGVAGSSGTGYPVIDTCRVLHAGTVVSYSGALVARSKFDKLTVHDCWDGVISEIPATGPYPHEITFVDCDINTQHRSIDFEYVSQLVAIATDTTRAPGRFDHAMGWTGYRVGFTGNLTVKGGRALDPNTGTPYTTEHRGFVGAANNLDIAGFIVRASSGGRFATGIELGHVARGNLSAVLDGTMPVGVRLATSQANSSLTMRGMAYSSLVTTPLVRSGNYNNATAPEIDVVRLGDPVTTGYTADATVTVDVRTSNFRRIAAYGGTGPFAVDLQCALAGAERNDDLMFNISLGGANPTVRILDNAGAVQLTLLPPGSGQSKRYAVHARLVGGGNGVWRIVSAVETLA